MARRPVNVISMSFLDAMTCGFGAIILFFMIIAANIDVRRDTELDDLTSQVSRMEVRLLASRNNLVLRREELSDELQAAAVLEGLRSNLLAEIRSTEEESEDIAEDDAARQAALDRLREELEALRTETERLKEESITPDEAGTRIRAFTGEGNRQYLTGLRMGGEHVVLLVDVSGSMLDRTLVNVIRRRNMPPEQQRRAPKWRQLVNTVDWLSAQIPPGTNVQIFAFNNTAWTLLEGSNGDWVRVTDGSALEGAVRTLRGMIPSGPTSLYAAFHAMRNLDPQPDNIYLLVDGLPTVGEVETMRGGVTSQERVRHFGRATRELLGRVPINVILLPMEGDPQAAPNYWLLALRTGGSMLAPSEDWP
jgi:hypothetical protein